MIIHIILLLICVILLLYIMAMKRQLRNMREELEHTKEQSYNRQLTVSLFDADVSELATQMNHNLDYQKQLKLKAEQSERKLRQSISDIAHDLRTPLTVIKGNLQMLEQHSELSKKEQTYLHICQDKADTLKNMVDDFFEMSVLESDTTQVALSDVDITNLLVQFIVDHEAVIREKKLVPEIILLEKSVLVKADEQMLLRMLGNLLNNVLKYAKECFSISLEEEDRQALITFANDISNETEFDVEHLFERTYRGDGARHDSGAGLGLYIVKLLAKKQGMEVGAGREDGKLKVYIRIGEV